MPNRNYADTYHRAQRHDQYRLLYVFDRTSEASVFYRVIPRQDRRQVSPRGEAALHPASLGQYDDDPPGIRQLGE